MGLTSDDASANARPFIAEGKPAEAPAEAQAALKLAETDEGATQSRC